MVVKTVTDIVELGMGVLVGHDGREVDGLAVE